MTGLDADAVRRAYRRQAAFYDRAFGAVSERARRMAIARINATQATRILEVGVGTGLALPFYMHGKRVTGIDLSADMLARARDRVASQGLTHVEALLELDAEDTGLPAASFDLAAAMFVASVVPHPDRLLAELKRLVRPGGQILFINHFSAKGGLRLTAERALNPFGRALGWHPDFPMERLLPPSDLARAQIEKMPPFGLFTLVRLPVP